MDTHHKILYGLCGGLAVAGAASVGIIDHSIPKTPSTWPTLTTAQATAIVQKASAVLGKDEPVNVYCIDRDCNKITLALRNAGKAANITVKTDRPLQTEDGVSVGAKTQETADALAKAVRDGSDGLLKPDAVDKQGQSYISFGHISGE